MGKTPRPTKRCFRCKKYKNVSEYDPKRDHPDRLKALCRGCCVYVGETTRVKGARLRAESETGMTYADRNENLRKLGFASYADYLVSDLWREVRRRVYAAKGSKCKMCRNPATELHHNRYCERDLTGEKLKFIQPICRACHLSVEFDGDRKTTVKEAAFRFHNSTRRKPPN